MANTYTPAPAITCTWAPETVLTGDKTTISISTTDANCTVFAGIAYGKLTPANGLTPAIDGRDTVVWLNGDQIIANSSKLVGKNGRGDTTFTISATAGTSTTQNHVKAFAYCSTGDKSGIFTQACALKIQVPPNPAKTGAMQWTNTHTSASSTEISSSSGYYYIGEVPAYSKGITVTNPDESRCGIVEYDETIATTAAGTNNIKVIAKCSQSGYKLDSIKASVLANPTLTGTCTWDTKNNTFGGGVSLTAKAPLVIINNSYGRCGATFFSQDGTTPITKVDTWEGGTGQTMTGVGVYVDCGVAGIVGPQVCPTITVEDPDAVFMDTPDGQI
ncbi:hypothetical protein AGMMS49938_07450 [Fibrobacterales bacterium]|nr:hypothetical protein AGMMS49938_07450 [Fibrobacterales bacterium]